MLLGKKYDKTDKHFELLGCVDKLPIAYKNAVKLQSIYDKNISYAKMKPCTTVYKIIDEIEECLNIKLK